MISNPSRIRIFWSWNQLVYEWGRMISSFIIWSYLCIFLLLAKVRSGRILQFFLIFAPFRPNCNLSFRHKILSCYLLISHSNSPWICSDFAFLPWIWIGLASNVKSHSYICSKSDLRSTLICIWLRFDFPWNCFEMIFLPFVLFVTWRPCIKIALYFCNSWILISTSAPLQLICELNWFELQGDFVIPPLQAFMQHLTLNNGGVG